MEKILVPASRTGRRFFSGMAFLLLALCSTTFTARAQGGSFASRLGYSAALMAEGFGEDGVSFSGVTLRGTKPITTLALVDDENGVKAGDLGGASGDATNIKMCPTGTDGGTYECILVPQEATYSVLIDATVGGEAKTYVYTPSAAYKFEPDRSYTLALKVKKADEPTAIESIDV